MANLKFTVSVPTDRAQPVLDVLAAIGVSPTLELELGGVSNARLPQPRVEAPQQAQPAAVAKATRGPGKKTKGKKSPWTPLNEDLSPTSAQARLFVALMAATPEGQPIISGNLKLAFAQAGYQPNSLGALIFRFQEQKTIFRIGKGEYMLTEKGKLVVERWRASQQDDVETGSTPPEKDPLIETINALAEGLDDGPNYARDYEETTAIARRFAPINGDR